MILVKFKYFMGCLIFPDKGFVSFVSFFFSWILKSTMVYLFRENDYKTTVLARSSNIAKMHLKPV